MPNDNQMYSLIKIKIEKIITDHGFRILNEKWREIPFGEYDPNIKRIKLNDL